MRQRALAVVDGGYKWSRGVTDDVEIKSNDGKEARGFGALDVKQVWRLGLSMNAFAALS
jgi:hypothetical protein